MIRTIIFDWKRTLYDPDTQTLLNGAEGLLYSLERRGTILILIGKGGSEMYAETERLKVKNCFAHILFTEEKKDISIFKNYLTKDPHETIFIGDRVRSELRVGNQLGAITIWLKQGKFAHEIPLGESQKPTDIVGNIEELQRLLQDKYKI